MEIFKKEKNILKMNEKKYTSSNKQDEEAIKRLENQLIKIKELKKEYALLPVWMVNVKYKDKMHIFAMNGQTGKFIGNIPLDKTKTVIYSLVIFIITLLISILVSYLIYKNGG